MKKFLTVVLAVLAVSLSLSAADFYVKAKNHSDPVTMMGQTQPATDTISETWISDNMVAMKTGDTGMIIDLNKKMYYMVNYGDKSYVETTLPLDLAKILPPEASAMMGMMTMTATVTPTAETKKIGQWNCKGYDMTVSIMGMPMKTKVWASTDVPFDTAKFAEKFMGVLAKGQMRLDDASLKELLKIKGYQIATEMDAEMMGARIKATMEVVEISQKNAPAGTYAVPAGFKKNATMSMADLQRR